MKTMKISINTAVASALILTTLTAAEHGTDVIDRGVPKMFVGSNQCIACHNNLHTSSGEDVSIGTDWGSSMMAHSAADPYWQAAVRREVIEHPQARAAIEDECSKCHMPMARYRAHSTGRKGRIFKNLPITPEQTGLDRKEPVPQDQLAAEGVSCATCHQIQPDNLGTEASFTGGFRIDSATPSGSRGMFGPYDVDEGRRTAMNSASTFDPVRHTHIQRSALCASCHTLYTHALGAEGQPVGELPEQVPYLEWRHSKYPRQQSCQDCHMPVLEEPMPLTSILGQDRDRFSRHSFRGGNFFMLRMLQRFGDQLGVTVPEEDLQATIDATLGNLREQSARLTIQDIEEGTGSLRFAVRLRNLAGHKLPTAYPSRRAWLHVSVSDSTGETVFESGALRPDGSIVGNLNDADPDRFEPHYRRISDPEQVQIYEAIMQTAAGTVTTGLLSAVSFIKDNRVVPDGFDKRSADPDIAVRGDAADDPDFTSGADSVTYEISTTDSSGPYTISAELWYQPVAYRWARNLRRFEAPEPQRFVQFYDALSERSAYRLASSSDSSSN